jgi:hypothetical protein
MYSFGVTSYNAEGQALEIGDPIAVIDGSDIQIRATLKPPPPIITYPTPVDNFDACDPLISVDGTGTEGGVVTITESSVTRCVTNVVGGSFSCVLSPSYTTGSYIFSASITVNSVESDPVLITGNVAPCSPSSTPTTTATSTATPYPTYCGGDFLSMSSNWNMVSFPLRPTEQAVEKVFTTPMPNNSFDLVRTFKPNDSVGDYWKIYDKRLPAYLNFLNDLKQVDETSGYWVHITYGSGTPVPPLPFEGCVTDPTFINVYNTLGANRWNLVGYPSNIVSPVATVFSSVETANFSMVRTYHASDTSDPWKIYDPALPSYLSFLNDLKNMEKKYGYWLQAKTTDSVWTVRYGPTNTPTP